MKKVYPVLQRICLGMLLLFFVQAALAQNRTIAGKVTDPKNNAGIPGVTVQVKGSQVATTTGTDE